MTDTNRPLRVFLCHSSNDKPAVRELYQKLRAEPWLDPWLDEKKLLPGQDWRMNIEEAIESSDVVIIFLSSTSLTKEGFVQKELHYAQEVALEKPDGVIFLIPIRLNDCAVPRGLRSYQWGNYFGEQKEQCFSDLIASLSLRHEQIIHFAQSNDVNRLITYERQTISLSDLDKIVIGVFRNVLDKRGASGIKVTVAKIEPQGITPLLLNTKKLELVIDTSHSVIKTLAEYSNNSFFEALVDTMLIDYLGEEIVSMQRNI